MTDNITAAVAEVSDVDLQRRARLRKAVSRRDGGRCAFCGHCKPDWTMDHVVPQRMGGADDLDNIRTLCSKCHNKLNILEATAERMGLPRPWILQGDPLRAHLTSTAEAYREAVVVLQVEAETQRRRADQLAAQMAQLERVWRYGWSQAVLLFNRWMQPRNRHACNGTARGDLCMLCRDTLKLIDRHRER